MATIDRRIASAVDAAVPRRHISKLAAHLELDSSAVSRRLSGETRFKASELALVAEFLHKPVWHFYTDPETWRPPAESLNVRVPLSQGALFLPDESPAFHFGRTDSGVFGIAS